MSCFRSSGASLLCAIALLATAARASEITLTDMEGGRVVLRLGDGESGLIAHFWASWCPSCVEELGLLDASLLRCDEGAIRVVAVNVGEDADTVRAFATDHGLRLPLLRDPEGKVWRALSGAGLPLNLIWQASGRRVELGPRTAEQWARDLAALGCGGRDPRQPE